MPNQHRILVVGPSWVGDMVMAQSLFTSLRQRNPDVFIAVVAPAWTEPLLERMPEVDLSLPAGFSHGKLGLGERKKLARTLRNHGFDQAIVLPRSIKSALAPWLAGIPRRTGFRGEMRYGLINDIRPLDKSRLPMTVQRFVFLGQFSSQPATPDYPLPRFAIETDSVARSLSATGLSEPRAPIVALCPGAEFGPAKRWPTRHFETLARQLIDEGHNVWLFGSDKDREITTPICQAVGNGCVDLAGRTTLGQAIDLMSLAHTVVSNDSGLMHVAAALDKRVIALYGSSSPAFTPPLTATASILSAGLDCSPCFKRECPLGHLQCLEGLMPERVIQAIQTGSS